jgi:hypothetical protein
MQQQINNVRESYSSVTMTTLNMNFHYDSLLMVFGPA